MRRAPSPSILPLLLLLLASVRPSCVDHAKQCGAWAARGECARNAEHMRRTCPKSCDACAAADEPPAELRPADAPSSPGGMQASYGSLSFKGRRPATPPPSPELAAQPQALSFNLQQHRNLQREQQARTPPPPPPSAPPAASVGAAPTAAAAVAASAPSTARMDAQEAQSQPTLVAALREVTKCRAARVDCQSELARCNQGTASHLLTEKALSSQDERCLTQLQAASATASKLSSEVKAAREEVEGERNVVRKLRQQLLQHQASGRAAESNCLERLANADMACHAQIDKLQTQLKGKRKVEEQAGELRKKLEQKEAIEQAIEGRHSKLTQVYKTLESECQGELRACRAAKAHVVPPSLPPPHSTEVHAQHCGGSSYGTYGQLLLALLLGVYIGNGCKPPRTLARRILSGGASTRRTHVEELRGWVPPSVTGSFESGMKLS
ncbi:hypothetical protein AB1Y20_005776 [Prymnesium parvum]|uniref:ShKT domain-containing protein n=1 Tax=Prymnesium parvum TaxID=97485 RepID=A0AB34J0R6_PRYPA